MSVTKEEVKSFVRAVRIEMDARNAAKFAPVSMLAALKGDFGDLEEKVADMETSGTQEEETISDDTAAELDTNSSFDASDVLDVFAD